MKRVLAPLLVLAALAFSPFPTSAANRAAADRSAADLLPASTIAYAELPRPKELIGVILDHPLRARLEQVDQYKQALRSSEFQTARTVVTVVEQSMKMPWRSILEKLTAGGAFAAFDPATDGLVLLFQASDEETLKDARDTFLMLGRADAQRKGRQDPFKTTVYRGLNAYSLGEAKFAVCGKWLVVTNKGDLGKFVLDRYLDGGDDTLAHNDGFKKARAGQEGKADGWAYLDMQTLRASGNVGDLAEGRTDNPVAELLLGGLINTLQKTPYVTAALDASTRRLAVTVTAPHQKEWVQEERQYFFGPEGKGAAPPLLATRGTLLAISTYRNVSQMWLRADDLYKEGVTDELAEANANLSTLFGGRDFGEDILGSIHPEMQLLLTRQDFGDRTPQPALKLPAGALVARLKDPKTMRGELRRTFVSLIGFLNVIGAMNGQPQLDFDIDKDGEQQVVATRFLAEKDEKDSKKARINFNFSPTIAFTKDLVIVGSTEALVRELLASAQKGAVQGQQANTVVQADLKVLGEILDDNRRQLVAQNMLEEGNSREEAEGQVDAVLAILDLFRNAGLKLKQGGGSVSLQMEVTIK